MPRSRREDQDSEESESSDASSDLDTIPARQYMSKADDHAASSISNSRTPRQAAVETQQGTLSQPYAEITSTDVPPAKRRRTTPGETQSLAGLPARKVFSIQIGTELFRLSGASISSDGQ